MKKTDKNNSGINQIKNYRKWKKISEISAILLPISMVLLMITVAVVVSLKSEIWIGVLVAFVLFAILFVLVAKVLVWLEKKENSVTDELVEIMFESKDISVEEMYQFYLENQIPKLYRAAIEKRCQELGVRWDDIKDNCKVYDEEGRIGYRIPEKGEFQ